MGGRPPTVSDEEILRLFIDADSPFLFTTEVAELLGFSQQGAYARLTDLQNGGYLKSKSMSEQSARGWWLTHAGREFLRDPPGG